jgi:DNA-binding MarR family transcriptional regulator
MAKADGKEAGLVLDRFAEVMFKLMMDHHQRQVVELDLTMPQAQALKLLRRGPLCTGNLAAELGISAPAVTQLTDRLSRKQLIERRAARGDRRTVLVALTDRGRRAVDRFRERRSNIFYCALGTLSEEDQSHIVLALGKVVAALENYEVETALASRKASNRVSRMRRQPGITGQ